MICGYFEKYTLYKELFIETHLVIVRFQLPSWFQRSHSGSYVELSPVVVAILDFRLKQRHKL